MYYMLMCQTPFGLERALLGYRPDRLADGFLRVWKAGKRFDTPPPLPVAVGIEPDFPGLVLDYYDSVIPVMTRRLAQVLVDNGVSNIDYYETEINDTATAAVHRSHVAFNLIGAIAAADLGSSRYEAPDGTLISVDFDSLAIDEAKVRGALMFRLAESVNGVVVHERLKTAIEAAGIDTMTFVPPGDWVS